MIWPGMPKTALRWPSTFLLATVLIAGLCLDQGAGIARQALIGAAFFAALILVSARRPRREIHALVACLWVSTVGELLLSVAWGLYGYRLDNVPLFVPPGHVMMFLLAQALARRMSERAALALIAAAALYAAGAAWAGFDVFSLALFGLAAVCLAALPGERRLFASTLLLSLILEIVGTRLGIWTWKPEVPHLGWDTTNPPAISGALYVLRDLGVAMFSPLFARELAPAATQAAGASDLG